MGREFLDIFTGWAKDYDTFTTGSDDQYKEVFRGYDGILQTIADCSGSHVIEFGIGTGNLTKKLLAAGRTVYPIEPSEEMRYLVAAKLPENIEIIDGDMQDFPLPPFKVDTIISSYVFHHLKREEKAEVLTHYFDLLEDGGKVLFADTMFMDHAFYEEKVAEAARNHFYGLKADLEREYYPMIPDLYHQFNDAGFSVSLMQMNTFVWIIEGVKEAWQPPKR
ncbi:class I SAM-dependent methyltransferase [Salinicoccus bachuensis]|uniref:Uncharacterized methyltransferase RQP18_05425 n=1 Tax=Salinicoccus bachuensis TaxID=3136731 RepID=A0ABZ3CLD0_9STAP